MREVYRSSFPASCTLCDFTLTLKVMQAFCSSRHVFHVLHSSKLFWCPLGLKRCRLFKFLSSTLVSSQFGSCLPYLEHQENNCGEKPCDRLMVTAGFELQNMDCMQTKCGTDWENRSASPRKWRQYATAISAWVTRDFCKTCQEEDVGL